VGAEGGTPPHLSCLRYLLEKDEDLAELMEFLLTYEENCYNVAALRLLDEAKEGAEGTPNLVTSTKIPDGILRTVNQLKPGEWDAAMSSAIEIRDLPCVKLLYDKGYDVHRSNDPARHPAFDAIREGWLEGLRCVVERSGPPDVARLACKDAVKGGVKMLQYLRELGAVFNARTTRAVAERGDLEALRFLQECGAPWDFQTIVAAVAAGSLSCLEYAHKHGCPTRPTTGVQEPRWGPSDSANNLAVLQYMCKQMDPTWAAAVLKRTASTLASWADMDLISDWQIVLFVERKLGAATPEALARVVAARKQRAATLAWVFRKAGLLVKEEESRGLLERGEADGVHVNKRRKKSHRNAGQLALWEVMDRVPKELQEVIAVKANLISR
jgi:hypothetical protein